MPKFVTIGNAKVTSTRGKSANASDDQLFDIALSPDDELTEEELAEIARIFNKVLEELEQTGIDPSFTAIV